MSTTKTFNNIKSGKKHQIDATARGYYDFRTTVVPQPNKPLSYDMKVYDGLNYAVDLSKNSVRAGEINFDNTILPYVENNTLTKTNYCFGNSGTNYDLPVYEDFYSNITKVGNVVINNDIASNFSASNYLNLGNLDFSGDYEIVLKFKTPETDSDATYSKPFFYAKTNTHFYIGLSRHIDNKRYICSDSGDGSNWHTVINGTTPLKLNTEYYVKVSRSGTTRTMYLSTDNVTWSTEGNVEDTYTYNTEYCLGATSFLQSYEIFKGSIDLKESKITIGENTINLGDTTLFPKYDLTFNANSSASYIKGSSLVGIGGNITIQNIKLNPTDKIKISYKYESGYNEIMRLGPLYLTATWVRNSGILPYLYYKTSESETSFSTYKQLGSSLVKDQWYNVEITMIDLNNLKVGFSIGENNEEYTYFNITDGYFTEGTYECTINGSSCNEINFSGLPGLTQLTESKIGIFRDYEDNGKAKTLNAFSSNNELVVLSPNENIVDYTWLGTVNIPKHKISWNEPSTPDEPSNEDVDYPLEAVALNDTVANYNVGDTIYVNEGMATSNYAYTAYAPEENNKNDFTIIGTITSKKEENGLTILSFDQTSGPTKQEVTITINEDNANVEYSNGWVKTVNVIASEDDANISTSTQMTQSTNTYNTTNYVTYNLKVEPVINNKEITLVIGGQKVEYDSLPVTVKKGTYAYYRINKSGYKEVYKVFHINNYSGQSISLEANN